MEIILAIVVASAVIFFGALISMGNERQRKAIDNLREQVVLWAVQDLRIKRERLARDIRVDDPLAWLNHIAEKACGYQINLKISQAFNEPPALLCISGKGTKITFTTVAPSEIKRLKNTKRSRLSQFEGENPLLTLPKNSEIYELSVLNSGILFDLELSLVWNAITKRGSEQIERLWMYKHD